MKKSILTLVLSVAAFARIHAQGTITVDNANNFGTHSNATSGGLFFVETAPNIVTLFTGPTLNIELLGGPNASSLSPVATLVGANAMIFIGSGTYADPAGAIYQVPGVRPGNNAALQVEVWIGNAATLTAAQATGALWAASPVFENPTGGEGIPPAIPSDLTGMPAIIIVPEPTTFTLGGLGAAALLLLRHRK